MGVEDNGDSIGCIDMAEGRRKKEEGRRKKDGNDFEETAMPKAVST